MITSFGYSSIFTFILCLILFILPGEPIRTEEGLELLFRERTQSDWEDVWHHEAHSRCRDKLVRQLYWACEKDIYRLTRRNRKSDAESITKRGKRYFVPGHKPLNPDNFTALFPSALAPIWLDLKHAHFMLRTRRNTGPSITDECCTKTGCTWEEYAEYCPSNKRKNHY